MRTFVNAYGDLYRITRDALVEVKHEGEWCLLNEKRSLLFLGVLALASHLDLLWVGEPVRKVYGSLTAGQIDKLLPTLTSGDTTDEEISHVFNLLHTLKVGAQDTDVTAEELRARLESNTERLAA